MNYTELLNELIESSGKTVKQIADECREKYEVNLTNTYLSGLKTTPGRQASQDINIAIAKACGAKYENILVVQAYLDKAPAVITGFLEMLKWMATTPHPFEKKDELTELLKADSKLTLAEFICQSVENGKLYREVKQEERKAEKQTGGVLIPMEVLKQFMPISEEEYSKLIDEKK